MPEIIEVVDIHSHLLYGIDDGARDKEMAMEEINRAHDQGVRELFLTSHGRNVVYDKARWQRHLDKLRAMVAEALPDMTLYDGCELLMSMGEVSEIISDLKAGIYPTLNGTRYVLTEFYPWSTPFYSHMKICLAALIENDYIPVLAHAERYSSIYSDPMTNVAELREMGCLVQINLYSVELESNPEIKSLANFLLSNRFVDFVGSDAHRTDHRPPLIAIGAQAIRERCKAEYADAILFKNARDMLIKQDSFESELLHLLS